MHAELQVLSPLVPVREVNFLRFCKQLAEGVWAVVDVSIDMIRETPSGPPAFVTCRRLPSGCVVQDMPNGYSKVNNTTFPFPCSSGTWYIVLLFEPWSHHSPTFIEFSQVGVGFPSSPQSSLMSLLQQLLAKSGSCTLKRTRPHHPHQSY